MELFSSWKLTLLCPLHNSSPFPPSLNPGPLLLYVLSEFDYFKYLVGVESYYRSLCDWLISSIIMSSMFVYVVAYVRIPSFFKADSLSLSLSLSIYIHTHPVFQSICLSMDTWVASSFWQLKINLLLARLYRYLFHVSTLSSFGYIKKRWNFWVILHCLFKTWKKSAFQNASSPQNLDKWIVDLY